MQFHSSINHNHSHHNFRYLYMSVCYCKNVNEIVEKTFVQKLILILHSDCCRNSFIYTSKKIHTLANYTIRKCKEFSKVKYNHKIQNLCVHIYYYFTLDDVLYFTNSITNDCKQFIKMQILQYPCFFYSLLFSRLLFTFFIIFYVQNMFFFYYYLKVQTCIFFSSKKIWWDVFSCYIS